LETREQALILAARHCCVCHRYKGIRVEVHHIDPESQGGANTPENAVALCFDCHADAGHYNPKHPKGTRYSPSEIRHARDAWHEIVKQGSIAARDTANLWHCRYFICKDFETIAEVSAGDIGNLPVDRPIGVRTPVTDFLKEIVKGNGGALRADRVWGRSFKREEEYLLANPTAIKTHDQYSYGQQWWEYNRPPTREEIAAEVAPKDFLAAKMLEAGREATDISTYRAFTDGCGDVALQEEYKLRSIWSIYLAVTNTSTEHLRLAGLEGMLLAGGLHSFRKVSNRESESHTVVPCPAAALAPGTTAVFPVGVLVAPLTDTSETVRWSEERNIPGSTQAWSHASFSSDISAKCESWGPLLSPTKLLYEQHGLSCSEDVHALDLDNVYLVTRFWECGCCPHLFALLDDGRMDYLGELFSESPGHLVTQSVCFPTNTTELLLAELEYEKTIVKSVIQDGELIAHDTVLRKGDYLRIPVERHTPILFSGFYELLKVAPPFARPHRDRKKQLIRAFSDLMRDLDRVGRGSLQQYGLHKIEGGMWTSC
jgi:hypothetical protein